MATLGFRGFYGRDGLIREKSGTVFDAGLPGKQSLRLISEQYADIASQNSTDMISTSKASSKPCPMKTSNKPEKPLRVFRLAFIAFCIHLALSCSSALADNRMLIIGVENMDNKPYGSSLNKDAESFTKDLLKAFASEYNYDLQIRMLPRKRLDYEFLVTRDIDLKYPASKLWETDLCRSFDILYSKPVFEHTDGILVRPKSLGKGLSSLKVLGVTSGHASRMHLPGLDLENLTLAENNSLRGLLEMCLRGRVDGIYANVEMAGRQMAAMGVEGQLVFDPELPHRTGVFHLATIDHRQILEEFNTFLGAHSALVAQLRQKHGLQAIEIKGRDSRP